MEVLEEALLVGGGCGCYFDGGLHVRYLHWVVSAGKEEKLQANQVECSPRLYRRRYESQAADTMRLEDVLAAQ